MGIGTCNPKIPPVTYPALSESSTVTILLRNILPGLETLQQAISYWEDAVMKMGYLDELDDDLNIPAITVSLSSISLRTFLKIVTYLFSVLFFWIHCKKKSEHIYQCLPLKYAHY